MTEVAPGDLAIKEECPVYQQIVENLDSPYCFENEVDARILQEKNGISNLKNETNHVEEPKIKVEKGINFFEETDIKIHNCLHPVVRIDRNFELEQALKEEIKSEPQNGGKKFYVGKSEPMYVSETNLCQDQTQTEQEDNASPSLTMFVCADCNKCYRGQNYLDCHTCGGIKNCSEFNLSELKNKNHSEGLEHVCSVCGERFTSKTVLQKHKACHRVGPFVCATCGLQFNRKIILVRHCKSHLNAEINTCRICKIKIKSKYWLRKHVASHFGNIPKPFSCSECGKPFKTKIELKIHLSSHTTERNYTCSHCKKSYKGKVGLQTHIKHSHDQDKKKYTCNECPKSFFYEQYVKIHKLKAHSELRPFSCDECGDTFNDRKCLQIHIHTHTGLKPFSCSFCGKKFAQLPHLRRHERLHTGVKPFLCKICGKSFRDSSNFKVHQIFHSGLRPFKCDKCKKTFTQRSHLNTHKKTHSEEKSYVCNICGDSFKQRMILKTHVLLHSDVKPFNCEDCGRSFVQQTAFKRHKCYYY